jgi:hypothetical protein
MTALLRRSFAAALLCSSSALAQETLPPPRPVVTPEPGVRVAEQGPIHEAFAQPGAQVRGKDMVAPKAPPAPVPELPPETKPEGNDVRWVPGYWQWEESKQDFIWVSGFWRDVPPGRDWAAGEWKKSGDHYRYEPGYWKPATLSRWRIDLPEPPKPLNQEPNTPAPRQGMHWIPGGWVYNEAAGQYQWQSGQWADPPANMMYQPGQYRATDYGYAYTPPYWDYCLEHRGLLYAPVYFDQALWNTPGWYYRPRFAINVGYGAGWGSGAFFTSLSIGPGFGSYYYGPYGSGWAVGFGFGYFPGFYGYSTYPYNYPWYYQGGGYYNSYWNHYRYMNGHNPNYATQAQQAAAAGAIGYNGVQSVPPGSRLTSPNITGAGAPGPSVIQSPANLPFTSSPLQATNQVKPALSTGQQKLVMPAQQVLTQQQFAARTMTPAKPVFTSSSNAIASGMSGQRMSFGDPITVAPNGGSMQGFRTDIGSMSGSGAPGMAGGPIGGTTAGPSGGTMPTTRGQTFTGPTTTMARPATGGGTTFRPSGPAMTGRSFGGSSAGGSRGGRGRE